MTTARKRARTHHKRLLPKDIFDRVSVPPNEMARLVARVHENEREREELTRHIEELRRRLDDPSRGAFGIEPIGDLFEDIDE
ncbi:MAG TPA: hypothetical protein VF916_15315 [Ktedonobacterales bacterium]